MNKVYSPNHYEKDSAADIEAVIDGLPAKEAAYLWNILKYYERRNKGKNKKRDLKKANNYAYRLVYGRWKDE